MVALGTMTLITNVPVPPVLMFIGIGIAFILSLAGLAVFGTAIRRRMAATSHD